jgi:peptidyl-prolyl cis-trans isomerase A (cyclophilin A)
MEVVPMLRREWFCVCLALVAGCAGGSSPTDAPPVPGAPALQTSAAKEGPADFHVEFDTTKGKFTLAVHRDWSPNGADRFRELVEAKFYDNVKFFRAVQGFMVQFGIHGDPAVMAEWRDKPIPDDTVVASNRRGYVTFAKPGAPNARTTQLFINYGDNSNLDGMGFSPFAQVVDGMDVVDQLNQEYGEEPSRYQPQIQEMGNAFLEKTFPNLDAILTARIVEKPTAATP